MLVGQGVRLPVEADFLERIEQVRLWDGRVLPPGLHARLKREFAGYQFMSQQVQELEAERRQLLRNSTEPSVEQVRRLLQLRGLGENSAWAVRDGVFQLAGVSDPRASGRAAA